MALIHRDSSGPPSRRRFLETAGAATLAALAAGDPRRVLAQEAERITPTADTLIVLWMGGGMAHTETFDPKRYTPFEPGLTPDRVLSTFPSIPTVVDGIRFSEGLEHLAKVMDRGTLIRSHVLPDLGNILHSRHQYHWHTGYVPPQTVACPHLGSWVARVRGPNNPAIPPFINIGQRLEGVGESEELKAFTTAGFLGSEYGPFNVPFPQEAAKAVRPPEGMTPGRFEDRNKFYKRLLEASPIGQQGSEYQRESFLRAMDNAHRLLSSPAAKAFDLSLEPSENVAKYVPAGFDPSKLNAVKLPLSVKAPTVTCCAVTPKIGPCVMFRWVKSMPVLAASDKLLPLTERPFVNESWVEVALLGNGYEKLLPLVGVVVAITFPVASTAIKEPAAVPSFGRKRSPGVPPTAAAPTTRLPPPKESCAYGEVVPMPTFPAPLTIRCVAEDEPMTNSGTPEPRAFGFMES